MLQNFKDGVKDWFDPNSEENKNYFKNQMYRLKIIGWIFVLSPFLLFLLIVVMEVEEQFNITGFLGIPCESIYTEERCIEKDKLGYSFVDGSGYISKNSSATSNVFLLKEVTSEFSVGNIVTIGDSKKEHEIVDVKPLNKSESGNSQTIIIMYGVGFETNAGMKVSVVRWKKSTSHYLIEGLKRLLDLNTDKLRRSS